MFSSCSRSNKISSHELWSACNFIHAILQALFSFSHSAWPCLGRLYSSIGRGGQKKICSVQFKLLERIYPSPLAYNHSQLPFLPFEGSPGCTCSFIFCVENVYQLQTLRLLVLKDFRCKLLEAWAKVSGEGNFSSWVWVLPRLCSQGWLSEWISALAIGNLCLLASDRGSWKWTLEKGGRRKKWEKKRGKEERGEERKGTGEAKLNPTALQRD